MNYDNDSHLYSELDSNIARDLNSVEQIHAEVTARGSRAPAGSTLGSRGALAGNNDVARTWIEQKVSGIWAQLLGTEEFGVDQAFVALGGHSLQAVQVLSRIRDLFGIDLPITIMFEQSLTVRTLAEALERHLIDRTGLEPDAVRRELRSMSDDEVNALMTSLQPAPGHFNS